MGKLMKTLFKISNFSCAKQNFCSWRGLNDSITRRNISTGSGGFETIVVQYYYFFKYSMCKLLDENCFLYSPIYLCKAFNGKQSETKPNKLRTLQ